MIIFGLSVFYIGLVGTGQFHCPNCGGDRDYQHKTARRFFTLFFLPVIPLNVVGEAVRCQTCRTRFDPAVLQLPTAAQMSSALLTGMRAVAVVVLRAGGTSEPAIDAAVNAVRRVGADDYSVADLHTDLSQPAETVDAPLKLLAQQLAMEARERYLAQAVLIGLADGPLTQAERDGIASIAGSLGMTPAHAFGVIATVEQSTKAE